MKLKKFFAGVLAAAMMLTVGATAAFADEGDNAAQAPTPIEHSQALEADSEIPLYKTYNVVNGVSPAETFTFQVEYVKTIRKDDAAGDPVGIPGNKILNLTGKQTQFGSMTAGSSDSGYFTITPTELGLGNPKGTGKYLYKISENAGSTAATTYAQPIYMAVTVAHKVNDAGEIQTGYNYYVTMFKDATSAESATSTTAENKIDNTKAFTNTYGEGNVHNVTLSKTVHGGFGDLGKTFYFTVRFNSVENVNYGVITATKSVDSIVIKKGTEVVQTTKPNGSVYNLDYDTDYTIEMKHGENVVFGNLPAGITYTMTENNKTGDKVDGIYNVENEVTNKAMENADATVAIINTNPESPDMGVVLDNAPYIAMLAIVAIGGVALMLNKRRRDEE